MTNPGTGSLANSQSRATRKLFCPPGAAMLSEEAWGEIARSLKLSGREVQILYAIFEDRTESAIAADLNVSPHTIHTYCRRLYHKLKVTGRVKLVLRVVDVFHALTAVPGTLLPPICANQADGRCPLRQDRSRFHGKPSGFAGGR